MKDFETPNKPYFKYAYAMFKNNSSAESSKT